MWLSLHSNVTKFVIYGKKCRPVKLERHAFHETAAMCVTSLLVSPWPFSLHHEQFFHESRHNLFSFAVITRSIMWQMTRIRLIAGACAAVREKHHVFQMAARCNILQHYLSVLANDYKWPSRESVKKWMLLCWPKHQEPSLLGDLGIC